MKKRIKGWLFFASVFTIVCVLRIWSGIFLIFAYALIETAFRKKRSFCYDTCPIGNLLDFAGDKPSKHIKENPKKAKLAGWLFFLAYLAFLAFVLISFSDRDAAKWYYFFRLMAGSAILALLAEVIFRKRFWCIYMCPLSKLMNGLLRLVRQK